MFKYLQYILYSTILYSLRKYCGKPTTTTLQMKIYYDLLEASCESTKSLRRRAFWLYIGLYILVRELFILLEFQRD